MIRILFIGIMAIFIPAAPVLPQKFAEKPYDTRLAVGAYSGIGLNFHNASFKNLPGIPSCCPRYEAGLGFGFSSGLLLDLPLNDNTEIGLRLGYNKLDALLTKEEFVDVLNPNNGFSTRGTIEHSVDSDISVLSLTPLVSFRSFDRIQLSAGFRAGYVTSASFRQKEEIISPSFGTFADGSRIRNSYSAEIPQYSKIDLAIVAGIGYFMPLNSNYSWFAVPEAFISYSILPISKSMSWRAYSINAGFSLKYAPREIIPDIPPIPAPYPPLPVPPDEPAFVAGITAVSVDENGVESNITTIKVEELLETQTHPLFNSVFFDNNSAIIPQRYKLLNKEETKNFSDQRFEGHTTLDVYYHILNIICKRLKENPKATITVAGYNSGLDEEKNNIELSRSRAISIRDYMINTWNIAPDRIKTTAGGLPPIPSSTTESGGIEENRRAEILASDFKLLEPIVVRDTIRELFPPKLVFKLGFVSKIGIDSWNISCYQSDHVVRNFSGSGEPPSQITWELNKDNSSLLDYTQPLKYILTIRDLDGKELISKEMVLPIQQKTFEYEKHEVIADKEIDKFTLTLFDFDKSDLDIRNRRIIESARKRIRNNSIVKVIGHTDNLGEEQHNLLLSQKRALAAALALGVARENSHGLGESEPLYDNKLPEERVYSRSVIITVETPLK